MGNADHPTSPKKNFRGSLGFERTVSTAFEDVLYCKFMPGFLLAEDIEPLTLHLGYTNPIQMAKDHLVASPGSTVVKDGAIHRLGTLVPARAPIGSTGQLAFGESSQGPCKFLDRNDRCIIHAQAPWACAFCDSIMSKAEGDRRTLAANIELWKSWHGRADGYADLWQILWTMGRRGIAPRLSRARILAALKQRG